MHPPADPALGIFALRRQTAPPPNVQWWIPFYQSPRLRVEAEEDVAVHHHFEWDYFALTRQTVAPAPPTPGGWVEAMAEGYYQGVLRLIGDVFFLSNINDLADASVNYNGPNEYINGWMMPLPGTQVPLEQAQSLVVQGVTTATKPRTVY